ncbi:uncharacterized protein C8Q71DRAFT_797715 [Rhodofomes roseus]|uniref:Uncharacterized protein n=1 Tax=Rhodofomes roseus TaxID=34475 RepID=A0ABQ8KCI2_9APHY|nr:uncharacterized protein C8Q71DRAFT_797715 [Rhodofomes roseus]KAH9835007.1 hypothetical protein C8Q71DRAFT_797715 [Rhodofomes roseus]
MQGVVSFDELCNIAKKDLVVVVASEEHKQEQLKEIVTESDPEFYLIARKDPRAGHKALCYKLPHRSGERKRGCEIHVLATGMLNIPEVPKDRVETLRGMPVMPLPILMFMKLQTWSDRRVSVQSYMKSRQHDEDVKDIRELLAIIRGRGGDLSTKGLLEWLPLTAVYAALGRMTEFAHNFPDTETNWRVVGAMK